MSDTSNLAGLALAAIVFSLSWPAARKYFKQWSWLQRLKFVGAILVYVALGLLWIPLAKLLTVRNAAGQAPPAAAGERCWWRLVGYSLGYCFFCATSWMNRSRSG